MIWNMQIWYQMKTAKLEMEICNTLCKHAFMKLILSLPDAFGRPM